ncbi:MAG TPA: P-loop NTPase fold protein [Sphingomicrobium sp.]|nr:P-loop NTPase fold protein [Sphingomicrobium sp.]
MPRSGGLGDEVDDFLRSVVNPNASALVESIQRGSRYAHVHERGPLLSRRALTMGILELGLSAPKEHNSSSWVAQWARRLDPAIEEVLGRQDNGAEIRKELASGRQLVASGSVREVMQEAQEIARATVGRDVVDLRHFLFVLSKDTGSAFTPLKTTPTPADLAELRKIIVDYTLQRPERGERSDEWKRLLAEADGFGDAETTVTPVPPKTTPRETPDKPIVDKAQPSPEPDDHYRTQTDVPAVRDLLEREPFARVLAERIRQLREEAGAESADSPAFMLHIHGRWGSGKSSVLNFLEKHLEKAEGTGKPMRVIWFNAWAHNKRRPPWWPFLRTIYSSVLQDKDRPLTSRAKWRLRLRWWWWRLRADILPLVIIAAVFGLVILEIGSDRTSIDTAVKIVAAVATASAAIYAYGRSLMFGSSRAAQAYSELKADAMAPVVRLFDAVVDAVAEPLVIIIDDLDRCDADVVVDLLEGIQILFKGKPVTYVAAADRKWICAAFEKRYADFTSQIGEPGRPLGYLFLEKMFQISAGMPKLTEEIKGQFLDRLTLGGGGGPAVVNDDIRNEARSALSNLQTEAQLKAAVDSVPETDEARRRAFREEAAIQITTPAAQAVTESRLRRLLGLVEANPRAMKRLVNDVAIAQARGFIEGRMVASEARARWAMLALRWPQLAEHLIEFPEAIAAWRPNKAGVPQGPFVADDLPEVIKGLTKNKAIASTVGRPPEAGSLDEETLLQLLR